MTDVEKSEILHIWHVCDVENIAIYAKIFAIYAILLLNLLFKLFCHEISCGEKLCPKVHLWRKNDKYQVWSTEHYSLLSPSHLPNALDAMPLQRIVPAASYQAGADVGVHNAKDRMHMKLILNL